LNDSPENGQASHRTQPENADEEHRRLNRLIRVIAAEVAYEVLEEHLDEYEHKPRKPDDYEVQLCEESQK